MGGRSSKTNKANYEVSHSVNGEVIATNINSKGKTRSSVVKKQTSKNSIKKTSSVKKSKSFKANDSQTGPKGTSHQHGDSTLPVSNVQIYRKKSSCPSCDAKDILLGKNRARSGSDKSLRFSDFTKVLRKTRVYEWESSPLDIPLHGVEEPKNDDICYICEVYTGNLVRACRVCSRAYHDSCLAKIGHPLRESSRRLIAAKMWNCHQCVSINHLLTQEEVQDILKELVDLDISKDNISEPDYLRYSKRAMERENKLMTSEIEQNRLKRYRTEASATSAGTVTFSQFLDMETIRILNRRCKDSLVHLLTKAELGEARKIFQRLDSDKSNTITKSAVQASLFASHAKTYHPDDSIMYIDEDLDSPVTWPDFLRDTAIYFLGQRPNTDDINNPNSVRDGTDDGTLTFSSCESLDEVEERYSSCNSQLKPSITESDPNLLIPQTNFPDNSAEPGRSQRASRSTMLDEINSEIDISRCRNALHDLQGDCDPNLDPSQPYEACATECTTVFSQTPGGLDIVQSKRSISPKSLKSRRSTGNPTDSHHSCRECRVSTDKTRSSPYNDSRHTPIPWEDVEKRPGHKGESDRIKAPVYRKSEVILRQVLPTSDQTRAVSQFGCRHGRNVLAPAYGNLVGRVNSEEWKC